MAIKPRASKVATTAVTLVMEASVLGKRPTKEAGISQLDNDLQDARSTGLDLVQQSRHAHVDVSVNSKVSTQPIASSFVRIQLPTHFLLLPMLALPTY